MGPQALAIALAAFALAISARADAFCGFFVAGADGALVSNATQAVLMRDGTKTVLSIQNNYQGPPENFALVVPVPVVLQKENVRTLPPAIFARVDALSAPRLVEYWEEDPCEPNPDDMEGGSGVAAAPRSMATASAAVAPSVKIEAQFAVGEYDVVVLSASDSLGLDAWLKQNGYKIPDGAEPYLRPYVEGGSKFFVAKVDIERVHYANGMATLSPLRFHYDADSFSLPVRLGLINSGGAQDLIVEIIARATRYEAASYPNVTIPTNLEVKDSVRAGFASFYAALFDKTAAANPRAVVTEYAWSTASCDPCPTPSLSDADLAMLGADVIPSTAVPQGEEQDAPLALHVPHAMPRDFVITRLHARYGKDGLGDDLVFRAAPPIQGGREYGATHAATILASGQESTFQARYIIRHPWEGAIACDAPELGMWGGPPNGFHGPSVQSARDLAFADRSAPLASLVSGDVPEIGLKGTLVPPRRTWAPSSWSRFARPKFAIAAGAGLGAVLAISLMWLERRRRA